MLTKRKQGIVLITTMLTIVLILMLLSSVVYSNFGGMCLTSNFYAREEALMAAQSGVDYALTKLQDNITWQGCDPNSKLYNSNVGLEVTEKDGNVWGMLTTQNGRRSFFRIKFNYEDGENGFDNMNNTSDKNYLIKSPYVSVNNLYSSAVRNVYEADSDGILKTKTYQDEYGKTSHKVTDGTVGFELPKSTCRLIVEKAFPATECAIFP
ncbi:MAG: hypothetical protein ACI38Q_02525 [Candidatus Bruticola sp.]